MPRVPLIYSDVYYSPLTEDVEELLARFQHSGSVRYEIFSAIWREMRFSDVFTGIINMSEMKRFCRVTLATAMKYFLPPYSYQIRVGGLYLMFAFYHSQRAAPPLKSRFALKDWPHIQRFVKDTLDAKHYDVAYVYQKLVAAKAIHYTAMPHFLTFQKQRKPKQEPVCAEFVGRSTAVQELVSADMLEELANIQNQYELHKKATEEVNSKVTMTHPDLASGLRDAASEFITWQQKTFSQHRGGRNSRDKEAKEESSHSRAKLLSSIKDKSYSKFQEAPKSRRHRQAETVDSVSAEQESAQKKRPPSLRARTRRSLGATEEEEERRFQAWLLSVPEQSEAFLVRKSNRAAP